tara:strand:+ start:769 stop:1071 length:303 start_codon:yes stop_codon:yes gene_type:complete
MKKTINFYDFERAFVSDTYKNQFTYEGKKALFEYLEEYEDSTGDQIELDVVALCCEYTEYDSIADFWLEYDQEDYPDIDAIEYNTQVIMMDEESFIIQNF